MKGIARTEQGKTVARAMPIVHYHGRDYSQSSVILSVNARRYEYFLTPQQCDTVEYLCKHVSVLKALNFAKSRNQSRISATST